MMENETSEQKLNRLIKGVYIAACHYVHAKETGMDEMSVGIYYEAMKECIDDVDKQIEVVKGVRSGKILEFKK